jgi:hypothetical protein
MSLALHMLKTDPVTFPVMPGGGISTEQSLRYTFYDTNNQYELARL